jgi:hypothetical protein
VSETLRRPWRNLSDRRSGGFLLRLLRSLNVADDLAELRAPQLQRGARLLPVIVVDINPAGNLSGIWRVIQHARDDGLTNSESREARRDRMAEVVQPPMREVRRTLVCGLLVLNFLPQLARLRDELAANRIRDRVRLLARECARALGSLSREFGPRRRCRRPV